MLSAPLQLREGCAQGLAKDWVEFVSLNILDSVIYVRYICYESSSHCIQYICVNVCLYLSSYKDLQIIFKFAGITAVFLIINQ
jgi:hypothetical protein